MQAGSKCMPATHWNGPLYPEELALLDHHHSQSSRRDGCCHAARTASGFGQA